MTKIVKNKGRGLAFVLSAAMLLGTAAAPAAEAAKVKKPKLSSSKVSVTVGSKKKVTVKNAKGVAWTVDKRGKKVVSLSKKSKKSVTIKGKAAGKAKVTAKMSYGKKKVLKKVITVSVRAKSVSKPDVTAVPTTAVPAAQTPVPSAPAGSTKAPDGMPSPANPTADPTVAPPVANTWVTTWGTAEEKCDITKDAMPKLPLEGTTVRQIIRVTTAGDKIRLRLSNQYGASDVTIQSMHLAKQVEPTKSEIDVATDTKVTVGGQEEFTIPSGQVIVTDEIDFSVNALDNVAISTYFGAAPTKDITGHRGARATTYQVEGNQVSEQAFPDDKKTTRTTTSWFFLADVSLLSPEGSKAVVCFGDSITDGYGTDASYLNKQPDSYTRWGDYFAKRLQENEKTKNISVINEGIGANSILGSYPTDAGKDRFARDLLEHDGVAYCIILFGVNDLNHLPNTDKFNQLLPEYQKMVQLCHDNGIKVYGAPILPFGSSDYYSEASEEVRTMINNWMRSEDSQFDAIIDFEHAVADPDDPTKVLEEYTHDDGLHPYDGYNVMADAIDLTLFED